MVTPVGGGSVKNCNLPSAMAALRKLASQSRKFEPSSFKDTLSMKARSHASFGRGAAVLGSVDDEDAIIFLQFEINEIRNLIDEHIMSIHNYLFM